MIVDRNSIMEAIKETGQEYWLNLDGELKPIQEPEESIFDSFFDDVDSIENYEVFC